MARNKYGNRKVEFNGIKFDSIKERSRYFDLTLMVKAGIISDLILQPKFLLCGSAIDPATGRKLPARRYIADFQYTEADTGKIVVEDAKSPATRTESTYRLKRHIFLYRYGDKYEFREV